MAFSEIPNFTNMGVAHAFEQGWVQGDFLNWSIIYRTYFFLFIILSRTTVSKFFLTIATKFLLNTPPTDHCAKLEASQIIKIHFMNWIYYVTFLIFVSGQSHENQALSHGETANHISTIKLQENFVSIDIREDNETVIKSTIDEEISSSSVATRSMFPFIFYLDRKRQKLIEYFIIMLNSNLVKIKYYGQSSLAVQKWC